MTATPRKYIFHFSYLRQRLNATPRIHELRDGEAFGELMPVLFGRGYQYGGLLLNQPPDGGPGLLGRLTRDDIVVLTTRPPIHDDPTSPKRRIIERTDSDLEKVILETVSRYFEACTRPMIRLTKDAARHLPPHFADRAEIEFRVYHRGDHKFAYYRLRNPYGAKPKDRFPHLPPHLKTTAVFLVNAPIQPGGPTLINAFGMDGVTTLLWCYLLRTKYPHLLRVPGFTMAEIGAVHLPPRPLDLSFADSCTVELLITPGGSPPRRRRK